MRIPSIVMIVHSRSLEEEATEHGIYLKSLGVVVIYPTEVYDEDDQLLSEHRIHYENMQRMRDAGCVGNGEVHAIWDGQSIGCIMDIKMAQMLGIPVRVRMYQNPAVRLCQELPQLDIWKEEVKNGNKLA